jgi:oligoendopeptidase F
MYGYFASLKNTFAASLKGNIKEDFFSSKVRKYNSPLEESLFADNIDISVYDKLIQTVHKHLPEMYEYMKVKKEILKLDEMHMYDIYVDLVDTETSKIPLEEGKKIIFEALKPLGEQYINDLKKAFSEKWIDIYPNIGKKSGAYSWGCYDSYPYLLMNYTDNVDSVSTMAHELGHSMHSYYSNKKQDYANHNYPIFLAEIASTTNEILLNEYCYRNALTKEEKVLYLTELLEKIRTTIYRQTMFAEFEKIMHDKEEQGISLTEEEFSNTYYELNKLYFGPNMISDEEIRYEWERIPHFYSPFYVYKYATGISAAIAFATDILNGVDGAKERYLEFLSSGGSNYPLEILKKAGINMEDSSSIQKALDMFDSKLQILKATI